MAPSKRVEPVGWCALAFFMPADNLRQGAARNAIQSREIPAGATLDLALVAGHHGGWDGLARGRVFATLRELLRRWVRCLTRCLCCKRERL